MDTIRPRACVRCGQPAFCTTWLAQSYDGIPSGREYEFKCGACGHTFRVLGFGQLIWSVIAVAGFGWVGFTKLQNLWAPDPSRSQLTLAIGVLCAAAAVAAALQLAWRIHVRASATELRDQ